MVNVVLGAGRPEVEGNIDLAMGEGVASNRGKWRWRRKNGTCAEVVASNFKRERLPHKTLFTDLVYFSRIFIHKKFGMEGDLMFT
jgi:hypothetical protein